ncbi:type VI secretion system tube protein Hcp [Streptomyces sp. NPDC051940]|uniref:Hcp family type VI secretion system effector n=1 Tax=Streptomyces sp. NPDC051940 TaxID=3155675 RepID=UPI0034421051
MKSLLKLGAVAMTATALLAGPATAAEPDQRVPRTTLFLKIDGIPGESTADKHRGEIEIYSYSLGASQSGTGGAGGGGGTGKVTFSDFTFAKTTDSASPLIFKSVATGTHHKEAVLTAEKGRGRPQPYLTIRLQDVLISGISSAGQEAGTAPTDKVTLDFAKVTMTSRAPDGSLVSTCWDVKTSRSC